MATLQDIGDALKNAHAAGDTAAATKLADAYAAMQAQGAAPAAAPASPPETSQTLGFEQGVGNFMANAAQPAIWAGKKLGFDMSDFEQGQDVIRNPDHAPNVQPGAAGRFAADTLESVPLGLAAPGGLAGTVASGALGGGLTAAPDSQGEGAALGGVGAGVLHGIGKAIAPMVSDVVQRLAARGVTMTPGQIFHDTPVKGIEDRVQGFPIIGDMITSAKNRSLEGFANGQVNEALGPLGRVGTEPTGPGLVPFGTPPGPQVPHFPTSVPAGMAGQDSVRFAGDTLGDAYNNIIPQTQTALGPDFWNGVTSRATEAARDIPPERGAQLQSTLAGVFNRMGQFNPADHTIINGTDMQGITTKLGQLGRDFSGSQDPDQRAMGRVYTDILNQVKGAVAESNPELAPQLAAVNEGYANLIPAERAAASATGNASGKSAGVFSPQQLRTAARAGDNTVRDRATARGEARAQQYAEDGIQVLPSSVGDSGTAGRASLLALPAMGAAAMAHPVAATALAAAPLMYSAPALRVFNSLYAHGAGPAQTVLGRVVQDLGRYQAGPVAGLTTRGRQ